MVVSASLPGETISCMYGPYVIIPFHRTMSFMSTTHPPQRLPVLNTLLEIFLERDQLKVSTIFTDCTVIPRTVLE